MKLLRPFFPIILFLVILFAVLYVPHSWMAPPMPPAPMPTTGDAIVQLVRPYAPPHSDIKLVGLQPNLFDSSWTLYHVGLVTSTGLDVAEGVAHYTGGAWVNVVGPGSGFCARTALPGVPLSVLQDFFPSC